MKKKFLTFILCICFIIPGMFLLSACSSDKEIIDFKILNNDNPIVITVGQFNNAGIEAEITYKDNTKNTISVDLTMIPEEYHDELNTVGEYTIKVVYKNKTSQMTVKIVNNTEVFNVKFYNACGLLISSQMVNSGENAVEPSNDLKNNGGYTFVRWDKAFTNVSSDLNIYAIGISVENELTNNQLINKLLNAYRNMNNLNFISTQIIEYDTLVIKNGIHVTQQYKDYENNAEYGYLIENNNEATTYQVVKYLPDGSFYNMFYTPEKQAGAYYYNNANIQEVENVVDFLIGEEQSKWFPYGSSAEKAQFEINYYKNKQFYTCTYEIFGNDGDNGYEEGVRYIYEIVYDNDKIISFNKKSNYAEGIELSEINLTTYFSYENNTDDFKEIINTIEGYQEKPESEYNNINDNFKIMLNQNNWNLYETSNGERGDLYLSYDCESSIAIMYDENGSQIYDEYDFVKEFLLPDGDVLFTIDFNADTTTYYGYYSDYRVYIEINKTNRLINICLGDVTYEIVPQNETWIVNDNVFWPWH